MVKKLRIAGRLKIKCVKCQEKIRLVKPPGETLYLVPYCRCCRGFVQ